MIQSFGRASDWVLRVAAITATLVSFATAQTSFAACPDFAAAASYSAGASPASVTVGDFNGDGRGDLAIANPLSNNVTILLGNANGIFDAAASYATGVFPTSVAAGDFNGDGILDLAVANRSDNNVSILLGNGSGGFTATGTFGAHTGPMFVATGDFDRDGRLDLAVANAFSSDVSILLGSGSGTFATALNYSAGSEPAALAIGDFNGDGKADLAVANYAPNTVSVLLGNGNGTFPAPVSYATGFNPWSVAIGDFNGDGKDDLAVANYGSNSVSILIGSGTGTFAAAVNYAAGTQPNGISIGDFNRDGKSDLAVANLASDNVSILMGSGTGTFAVARNYTVGSSPQAVATGDFDGDGKTDLAIPCAAGSVAILINNGACYANCGAFAAATGFGSNFGGTFGGSSVASADFNRDGTLDLAVVIGNSQVSVLLGNGSGSFGSPADHTVGSNPVGVAIADFNRDGKLDLAVANESSDSVSFLLGNGSGGFGPVTNVAIPVTEAGPKGLTLGDFDRDGRPDVAVTCGITTGVAILLNTTIDGAGTPSFTSSAISSVASLQRGVATGDFNRDGKLDLAIATYGDGSNPSNVVILHGTGNGGFTLGATVAAGIGPQAVAAGDFNGDGKLDLAVSNFVSNTVSILLGNGSGGFVANPSVATGTNPFAIAVGDFDNNGKLDLAVANRGGTSLSMLLGDGTGGFTAASPATYAAGDFPSSVAAADLNRDGRLDLAVANANASTNVSVLLNNCPPPDLTVTMDGLAGIYQGGSGGLTVSVTNTLSIPTTGRVTVTVTLPAGLTATSISGTTWDCVLTTLTCRRSDSLPGNSGFSLIMLGVNVASTAPALVSVTATVSGGSEANTANDTATLVASVAQFPDMTLTKTHSGNFSQGQTGVSYTITVTNIGGLASSGTVTVTDTLPAGLTATAMSGSGWTCGTVTCSRSDALLSGSSYPAITLTVSVATSAGATVNNSAAVSGGSQIYSANDTATDPTTIVPLPDLTVTKTHAGNFAQSQTGRTCAIAVSNAGSAATSGTVTVTDTLPTGLTATAIRGNGWACILGTLTCTRSDVLAAGLSYPVITLTVKVASDAPASVTNTATVSGGGEIHTANDIASDLTAVTPGAPKCGTFAPAASYPAGGGPGSVAIGDFNADGRADLAVASFFDNGLSILMGNGSGTFGAPVGYAGGTGPYSVATGDFNGDGKLDLALANYNTSNLSILIGNGDGTFVAAVNYPVGTNPRSVDIGDFSGDGKLDLVVANQTSGDLSILIGNGNGTFAPAVAVSIGTGGPFSVSVGDFNGDGKPDLAAAKISFYSVSILLGNGNGTFSAAADYAAGTQPYTVAIGDLNGDGRQDLAVANANSVSILLGNGDGTFVAPVSYTAGLNPASVAIVDFDGDGRQDLAVANGGASASILRGNGDGTFAAAVDYATDSSPNFIAAGDFNADGRPDLAVANFGSNTVSILLGACADLMITKSHTGNFTQGETGVSYTLTASNAGPAPTGGTVTVTDSLPFGLTATAIGGAGWTCTLGTLTCTRSDAFAAGGTYPVITLTVNVNSNAAASVTNSASVSGEGDSNAANNTASDPTTVIASGLIAPTRLVATAVSTSQIFVFWDAVTTAVSYQVYRSDHNGAFALVGTTSGNTFPDPGLMGSTTYLYRVQAVNGGSAVGPPSNVDLATTTVFTDDLLIPALTVIKAVHMTELRTAVDAVRAAAGLANATYSNAISAGATIKAADMIELRSNLNAARSIIGLPSMAYIDPSLTAGIPVKAAHILSIRTGTKGVLPPE